MLFEAGTTAVVKKSTSAIITVFAILGVTPNDIPLIVAIVVGMLGGTAAAWAREKQSGRAFPRHWLLMQFSAYVLIAVIVIAFHEYPGLTTRWSAAMAGLLSFASREGLQAIHKRTLREIEEREIK